MKIFHVTLALFFSMLLMLPLQCANAEALLEQDGIVVEFITNKVDYTSNEDVSATVKVTNSRMQTIQGVSIDVELPASFELKDGSLAEDSIQLLSGESYSLTFIAGQGEWQLPQTGDESHLGLYSFLAVMSGIGCICLFVQNKKAYKGLCLVLAVILALGFVTPNGAVAIESIDTKGVTNSFWHNYGTSEIRVIKTIQVSGIDYDFSVSVIIPEGGSLTDPSIDTDGDGMTDYEEYLLGSDPLVANAITSDTDGDGLKDLDEVRNYGTNPKATDSDNDGLNDSDEVTIYHTDPNKMDTDEDGLDDGFEVANGLNPNNKYSDDETFDGDQKFSQAVDETCISDDLLSEDNIAIPSVFGYAKGQINNNVFIAPSSYNTVLDSRVIIGEPVLIDSKDEYVEGLTLEFDLERFVEMGGSVDTLVICKINENDDFEPMETELKSDSISCVMDGAGTYFVLELDLFLNGLGIDITEYAEPEFSVFGRNAITRASRRASIYGQADIVFVVDTTGSMSGGITGVINNITEFADALANKYNVQANYALVEYRDLSVDGTNSTRIIKNGAHNWFTDVQSFKNKLRTLSADGGGDTPECTIDALETARRLDFRSNSCKHIILITDAGYKTLNSYDLDSLEDVAELLENDGITTSVVTTESVLPDYQILLDTTSGIFANINNNFSSVLLQLAENIGEDTAGEWVILKPGYSYVQLPGNSDGDCDNDGLTDSYELGQKVTVNLNLIIEMRLRREGVPLYWYYGKNTIEVYQAKSDPTRADTDNDGIEDKKDTAPWKKGLKDGIVGALKICSYGTPPAMMGNFDGHAYVAYTSFIDDQLELYGILVDSIENVAKENDTRSDRPKYHVVNLESDTVISLGGWAGWLPDRLKGSWINNEYMYFVNDVPDDQRSLMQYITDVDVEKMEKCTKDNHKWTYYYNCSAYATDLWNEATGDNLSAYNPWYLTGIITHFRSPAALSYNMEKRSDCQIKDPIKAEWP